MSDVRNVVLVHGGFVDGSGWQGVYDLLTADGFNVSVVQNQTLSLESDVETTTNVLDLQDGPAILVGHSYGGAVITEAGTHGSVAGLVYVTAFAPDQGESVSTLIADPPPGAPVPPILPPQDGFLFLDRDKFAAERLHAKVANWRCRPKGASGDFLVERPVRLETAVRRPRRGDRSSATTVVRGRQPAQRRDRW